jgi:hypothetical protein
MTGPYFPFIILPQEFLVLLKTNLPSSPIPKQIIEILSGNKIQKKIDGFNFPNLYILAYFSGCLEFSKNHPIAYQIFQLQKLAN